MLDAPYNSNNTLRYAKIYLIIDKFSYLIFNDLLNVDLIKKDSSYPRIIAEIMMFLSWELDVCMSNTKQKRESRRACLSVIARLIADRLEIKDYDLIKKMLLKRLLEFAEIEKIMQDKSKGNILLLGSLFRDNLDYACNNNDFYYHDEASGVRPFLSLDFFRTVKYTDLIMLYHIRIRIFFLILFENSNEISLLSEKEFESNLSKAEEKDKKSRNVLLKDLDKNTHQEF